MAARDITRALKLVDQIEGAHPIPGASSEDFAKLRKILRDIDARTGTRDPAVKKAAKKAKR